MYAIVDVKDKQFKVREDDTLYVPYHAEADVDEELTLDRVLLVSDGDGDVTLGTPTVDDATVQARVVDHVKGDKVIVFKKKRRKRYRVKRGHRQQYTQIEIEALHVNGAAPEEASAEEASAEDEPAPSAAEEAETAEADETDAETDADTEDTDDETTEAEE
jgi:large subunit ribosomal protein L21